MVINKRVMGLLAVTRSFGDHSIKEFVISEPYIQSRKIIDDHSFIVLACDGVFEVLRCQNAGGKTMDAASFLNGYRFKQMAVSK